MKRIWAWTAAILAAAAFAAAARPPSVAPGGGGPGIGVTLTQLGFSPVKKPKVQFAPQAGQTIAKTFTAKVVSFTSTEIDVLAPGAPAGTYDVVVTPKDKGVAPVTLDPFTMSVPKPTSVDPTSGPWKTVVTIQGTEFGAVKGKVTIGGKNAKVTHWSDTSITAVVPTHCPSGEQPVVVSDKAGASDGALMFDCTGAPPPSGTAKFDEFLSADLSGKGHFECTNAKSTGFIVSWNPSNSQLTFGGTSQPTKGFPDLDVSILPLDVTKPTPYDVSLSPTQQVAALATLQYTETTSSGVVLHTASLGATGSSLDITITGWDGTFLTGTFTGTLVDVAGKTSPILVTNGQFRTRDVTGH